VNFQTVHAAPNQALLHARDLSHFPSDSSLPR
jgi:hypothetical protein